MDDDTRAALRDLARQAEWGTPQGGDEAEAARLGELGRALERRAARDQDAASWANRSVAELAAHCRRAVPTWTAGEITTLARLREAALIALAPGPEQADLTPSQAPGAPTRVQLPRGRRAAAIGLAVVGCAVVAGIAVAVSSRGHHDTPASSATSSQAGASVPATGTTVTATTASTGAPSSPNPSTTPSTSPASSAASGAHVTGIQMTATPADGYPEVQVYGTITASGTGDVTVTITVTGTSDASGAPQTTSEDESGQTSYALSQTIYLQQWCGQKSVTVTVSSGGISKSAAVAVSGC